MKSGIVILTLSLVLCLFSVKGQDVHFSQYYFSPLTLNPAHTANINGLFRATAIYRNQWYQIQKPAGLGTGRTPFETFSASFDTRILPNKLDNDRFGFGLVVLNDKVGNGALTTQSAMLSIAYHKAIDQFGRHQLSLGMQGGVVQKRIFLYDLIFETQLSDLGFNTNLSSGEEGNFDGPILYPDFNIGLMWQSKPRDWFAYYAGAAVNHIATPNESFFGSDNELAIRWSAHGGMEFKVGDYTTISPSFLFMLQSNAQQWNIGAAIDYELNPDVSVFFGGWTRLFDAAILSAGFDWRDLRLAAAYDINFSDLRAASNSQGAFELALVYIHNNQDSRVHYERYCPNF